MWNTNPPDDYSDWEAICCEYTKHITERYGENTVNNWRLHCFNEPDLTLFFMSDVDNIEHAPRCEEYLKLYEGFVNGVRRANATVRIGGPALGCIPKFMEFFLNAVKARRLELNYISFHVYGTDPFLLNSGEGLSVETIMDKLRQSIELIEKCGFSDLPIVVDEWGASSHGFYNKDECKMLMFRETEVNAAYFIRFISELINSDLPIQSLMICLSGQHEMTEDFSGFRNFFTLNFLKKPIYNAYILASKLHEGILEYVSDNKNISAIATKSEKGEYAVALAYAGDDFSESIPNLSENVSFSEDIVGKQVTVWRIDRQNTNPYRAWEEAGKPEMNSDVLKNLRNEGIMKPYLSFLATTNDVKITFTANSTYLITIK